MDNPALVRRHGFKRYGLLGLPYMSRGAARQILKKKRALVLVVIHIQGEGEGVRLGSLASLRRRSGTAGSRRVFIGDLPVYDSDDMLERVEVGAKFADEQLGIAGLDIENRPAFFLTLKNLCVKTHMGKQGQNNGL